MVKTVIGLFPTHAEAKKVVDDLVDKGISRDEIQAIPAEPAPPAPIAKDVAASRVPGVDTFAEAAASTEPGSVAVTLIEIGMPEAKAVYYSEAVRRGGTLVLVTVDEAKVDQVRNIIDAHGSLDINNLSAAWRDSGWEAPEEEPEVVVVERTHVCDMPSSRRRAS
jgi:hypothetical protein